MSEEVATNGRRQRPFPRFPAAASSRDKGPSPKTAKHQLGSAVGCKLSVRKRTLFNGSAMPARRLEEHPIDVLDRGADRVVPLRVVPKAFFVDCVSPRTIPAMCGELNIAMRSDIRHRGSPIYLCLAAFASRSYSSAISSRVSLSLAGIATNWRASSARLRQKQCRAMRLPALPLTPAIGQTTQALKYPALRISRN
jgi:hypothetical protein